MTATAQDLTTVIRHWPDLTEALGSRTAPTWPPAGRMSDYMRALEQRDAEQMEAEQHRALTLRTLERDPTQIGVRPIPIRLTIHETMRVVQAALVLCADQIAGSVQRPVMGLLPDGYPKADLARRQRLALRDRQDPRRWSWTGTRPSAQHAALWLLGRVQGVPGPFRPLTAPQLDHVASVARGAADRVVQALDVGERTATLTRPCPQCKGTVKMYGGAGASPVARCTACGHVWSGALVHDA
ncbi:hypothetical protein AB0D09_02810 [Streptomyces sp. NPDC049097]|uniref:hypothetical protein n=1 Tax=Streptomyces sp. NPDC049097 TaxID=3155497 RepID=UPI00342C13CA